MSDFEKIGIFDEKEMVLYSEFNVEMIESEDATSPVWSNVLKTVLAMGSMAACAL